MSIILRFPRFMRREVHDDVSRAFVACREQMLMLTPANRARLAGWLMEQANAELHEQMTPVQRDGPTMYPDEYVSKEDRDRADRRYVATIGRKGNQ